MVEEWIDKVCYPLCCNGTRLARTDAMNFHHCVHHIGWEPDYAHARILGNATACGKAIDDKTRALSVEEFQFLSVLRCEKCRKILWEYEQKSR